MDEHRVDVERLAVSVSEAAESIGVSERFVWKLMQRGEMPHRRVGRRVLIPVDRLREWLVQDAVSTTN